MYTQHDCSYMSRHTNRPNIQYYTHINPHTHMSRHATPPGPYLIDYVDDLLDLRRGCYMVLSPVCRETMEQVCVCMYVCVDIYIYYVVYVYI